MARLASSSAATSAPPMRCTRAPGGDAAPRTGRGAAPARCTARPCRRAGPWPLPSTVTCRPASSIRSYVAPGDHRHAAVLELGAVDPAGGLAEPGADLGRSCAGAGARCAAARGARARARPPRRAVVRVDAPLAEVRRRVLARLVAAVGQELRDVEADAAGADDRDPLADRRAVAQHVEVADDARVVDAGDLGDARGDAGGDDDLVEAPREVLGGDAGVQPDVHAVPRRAACGSSAASRRTPPCPGPAGDVELAADLARGVEQRDLVAALGGARRRRRARPGPAPTTATRLRSRVGDEDQLGLVAGARVDQAGGDLAAEGVVEAGLVAADAGVDRLGAAVRGLGDEVGVGEERAGPSTPCRRARRRATARPPRGC